VVSNNQRSKEGAVTSRPDCTKMTPDVQPETLIGKGITFKIELTTTNQ